MPHLIDHLAHMTRLRDGDVLDVAMAGLTRDLLRASRLAIHRVVNDAGTRRWLTTAHADGTQPSEQVAEIGQVESWPRFEERESLRQCLESTQPQVLPGQPTLTLHPLATSDEVTGVMEIASAEPLDDEQQHMVQSLLGFYRHLRSLIDENERDSLTGLLNRKTFDGTFMRAAMDIMSPAIDERAAAQEQRWWLGVVDIDHFKRINDGYGHLIGDEVLLLLAHLMGECFRHGDRLYRFGGEEFVALLRAPSAEAAAAAFERLRRTIETHDFPQVGQLTVSIGYSAVQRGDTPSAAFERADRAVYHAKETGRNRVVAHADLDAPMQVEPVLGDIELF